MHPNPTPLHEFAQFLGCEPPPPAKTCLSAWIYPGMGYVMHFFTPTPAYGPAYLVRIFHNDPVWKKWVCPPPLSPPPAPYSGPGPAYIYDLIFVLKTYIGSVLFRASALTCVKLASAVPAIKGHFGPWKSTVSFFWTDPRCGPPFAR